MADISIGETVKLIKTGEMAVVKYIGSTHFKTGIWYGLQLDGPNGTHDGIVEGKRYFQCPANHGRLVQVRAIQSVEETIFRKPARVFAFNAEQSAWTEKGTGAFTLRQSTQEDRRARIYMKKDNNSSVFLVDHPINPKTQLEKSRGSDTAWVYKVKKHKVSEEADEVLAVQFGNATVAMDFHRMHAKCCDQLKWAPTPAEISKKLQAPKATSANNKTKAKRRLTIDGVNNKINLEDLKKQMQDMELDEGVLDASSADATPAPMSNLGVVSEAGRSKKGYSADPRCKPFNQDALVNARDPKTGAWLFAVFDGHGEVGHDVSGYIKKRFAHGVFTHSKFPAQPALVLKEVILGIEESLLEAVDCRLSGTTAVMCVIHNGLITCANIGDSRLVVGSKSQTTGAISAKDISHDHKPDLPAEKKRIEQRGGRVFAIDYGDDLPSPARVWLRDAQLPGLAMSRSVGDTVGKAAGVISTPEITTHVLTADDQFCIIASDGLWEFIESAEAVKMVFDRPVTADALKHCMEESHRRWLMHEVVTDDTTVCIMKLGKLTV